MMTSKRCILSLTSVLKCFSKNKFLITPKRYHAIPILRPSKKPAVHNPLRNALLLASKNVDTEYCPCRCEGRGGRLRWPTTVTSKPNAHSKLKIAHIKFKSLTANSNRSQQITNRSHQIQIAHIKFKSLTSNSNRSQQITNRSQQIQIAHSKFKSFTAN